MSKDKASVEEMVDYNLMLHFFEKGATGTRAANALWLKGIRSMHDLSKMFDHLGEQEFFEYLKDLRNIGEYSRNMILRGLRLFRDESGEDPIVFLGADGKALPRNDSLSDARKNFRTRLHWTARYLRGHEEGSTRFPEVKGSRGEALGLMPQDIVLLSRIFGEE